MYGGYITDVQGIKVGHAQDLKAATGCTVILCEDGGVAGVDVRGGAPGTRETDCLRAENTIDKVHAVVLAGGSSFGLDCAAGVMRYLQEQGIGFETGFARIPIVPGAVLFDLVVGDPKAHPDSEMGYIASKGASGTASQQGNVGAGVGATVGKVAGVRKMMKGGIGSACWRKGDLAVGAIVAVNCLGDVLDPKTGQILAGTLTEDKKTFANSLKVMLSDPEATKGFPGNTTIGVVATNAQLTKPMATRVGVMAHDGYARTIQPVHTLSDGDTIFCLSTGKIKADVSTIGAIAASVMAQAVANGVTNAKSLHGVPAYRDLVQ